MCGLSAVLIAMSYCVLLYLSDYGLGVGQLKDTTNILVKTTKLTITAWSNGFPAQVNRLAVICQIGNGVDRELASMMVQ